VYLGFCLEITRSAFYLTHANCSMRKKRFTTNAGFKYWWDSYSESAGFETPMPGVPCIKPPFLDYLEVMDSDYTGDHWQYKQCSHYKMTVTEYPYGNPQRFWVNYQIPVLGTYKDVYPRVADTLWSGSAWGAAMHQHSGAFNYGPWGAAPSGSNPPRLWAPDPSDPTEGVIPVADWPGMIRVCNDRALKAMLPQVHRESNGLVNDIIELRDFKTLPRTLNRLSRVGDLYNSSSASRLATLKAASGAVSDAYLQYSFNIAPVVSDVFAVWRALHRVNNQLRWLVNNRGKILTTHWKQKLQNEFPDTPGEAILLTAADMQPWSDCPQGCQSYRFVKYDVREFNATMQYQFDTDATLSLGDQAAALADSLGFNINPAIIWNAVRWTFLIDWVIDVSSWLDQFRMPNINSHTRILQYCWSLHIRRTTNCWTSEGGRFAVSEDAYTRQPAIPNLLAACATSGLDSKEFSLGAALGISRATR